MREHRENNPGDSRCKLLPLAEIVAALSQLLLHTCQKNNAYRYEIICKHYPSWLLFVPDKGYFADCHKKAYRNMQSFAHKLISHFWPGQKCSFCGLKQTEKNLIWICIQILHACVLRCRYSPSSRDLVIQCTLYSKEASVWWCEDTCYTCCKTVLPPFMRK